MYLQVLLSKLEGYGLWCVSTDGPSDRAPRHYDHHRAPGDGHNHLCSKERFSSSSCQSLINFFLTVTQGFVLLQIELWRKLSAPSNLERRWWIFSATSLTAGCSSISSSPPTITTLAVSASLATTGSPSSWSCSKQSQRS